nr:MAG TPA: hypothetical protein [Caudoviricetes sp.]
MIYDNMMKFFISLRDFILYYTKSYHMMRIFPLVRAK